MCGRCACAAQPVPARVLDLHPCRVLPTAIARGGPSAGIIVLIIAATGAWSLFGVSHPLHLVCAGPLIWFAVAGAPCFAYNRGSGLDDRLCKRCRPHLELADDLPCQDSARDGRGRLQQCRRARRLCRTASDRCALDLLETSGVNYYGGINNSLSHLAVLNRSPEPAWQLRTAHAGFWRVQPHRRLHPAG